MKETQRLRQAQPILEVDGVVLHKVHGFDPVVHRCLLVDVLLTSSMSTK